MCLALMCDLNLWVLKTSSPQTGHFLSFGIIASSTLETCLSAYSLQGSLFIDLNRSVLIWCSAMQCATILGSMAGGAGASGGGVG